ncbi:zinc ribbon domain-containing protein [Leifsonia sp. A12D58]|uniref:zinc ribbon domain-containing protein n=1 Tax=Leifsonia sp. A12D58 TaxID=3397674 RepID=UPI0039E057FE
MKATPVAQKELLRLQALDTKVQQLEHKAKALSQHAEIAALTATADAVKVRYMARLGELDDVRTELSRIESDVDVVQKRIERDTDRLQHTSSVKDVQALETELAALKKRQFDLEEIEITVMERLEEHERALALVQGEREEIAARIAELEQVRDADLVEVKKELDDLVRDRAAIAANISDELIALYEKRRVAGHGHGAALLRARTCGACTMTLTGNDLETVRNSPADDVVFCPDCGTILVRTEESGI